MKSKAFKAFNMNWEQFYLKTDWRPNAEKHKLEKERKWKMLMPGLASDNPGSQKIGIWIIEVLLCVPVCMLSTVSTHSADC